MFEAKRVVSALGEFGSRPIFLRSAESRAALARRRGRGRFSFGDSSLTRQRKVTCVCCTRVYEFRSSARYAGATSTTHEYIHYMDNRAERRDIPIA
jgi:hypothetical protein